MSEKVWTVWVTYKRNAIGRVHREEMTGVENGKEADALALLHACIRAKHPNCRVVHVGGTWEMR